jgi:hypothetical protein
MGHIAQIPGIPIYYTVQSWALGYGGHLHDTSLTDGHPIPQIVDSQPLKTGTNGCVTYHVNEPWTSGYFNTVASIPQPYFGATYNGYSIACTPTYVDLAVSNRPITRGTWINIPFPGVPGCTLSLQDTAHARSGQVQSAFGDPSLIQSLYNSGPSQVCGYYNANKPTAETALIIDRISLPQGGYLDGYLVGPLWSQINADPHMWGYSFDVVSPLSVSGKGVFFSATGAFCANGAVYDFYNQSLLSYSEGHDNLAHIWHVKCPTPSYTVPAYPN